MSHREGQARFIRNEIVLNPGQGDPGQSPGPDQGPFEVPLIQVSFSDLKLETEINYPIILPPVVEPERPQDSKQFVPNPPPEDGEDNPESPYGG